MHDFNVVRTGDGESDWKVESIMEYTKTRELILVSARIQKEYEYAIDNGDKYGEADGLMAAIRVIDERILEISEKDKS